METNNTHKGTVAAVTIILIIILGAWFYFAKPGTAPSDISSDSDSDDAMEMDTADDTMSTGTNRLPSDPSTPKSPGADTDSSVNTTVGVTLGTGVVKSFNVTGQNFSFTPNEIRVKKGDTVKVTFTSNGTHDFVIDEFNARTAVLRTGDAPQTIEFVADKTGSFEYYCSVGSHRQMGMVGRLIVE